ncbi:MAG: flagellar assembly protein A [Planctomycetota bacterium]
MKRIRDRLRVQVAPDGLQATVEPIRRAPRQGVSPRTVEKLLAERGVTHGILTEAVREFVGEWRQGQGRQWIVARGEAPIPAVLSELRRVHPPARSGRDPVELLPLYVAEHETVFALRSGAPATPGRTVCGVVIPPPQPPPSDTPTPGEGFEVVGRVWKASHSGFLEHADGNIRVSPQLIHKYDLPAGEYHWHGGARIDGSLLEGVRLHVDGDLALGGEIAQGVRLRVGGDATVEGAIRGEGRTRVEVDGQLECAAVLDSFLYATADVRVRTLCQGTTVRTCGRFLNDLPGGLVSSSRIDAVRGAILNDIVPGSGLPSAVHVGTSEWLDDEWQAVEAEIQRWTRHYTHLYEEFSERHAKLVSRRSEIYRLSDVQRQQYELEHARVTAEQERVDRNISRLRTRQSVLLQSRCRDEKAVVQVTGEATAGALFSIRRVPLAAGSEGLREVVLSLAPSRNRVIAIPRSIYESSLDDHPAADEVTDEDVAIPEETLG